MRLAGVLAVTIVSAGLFAGAAAGDASSDALIHADAARAAGFTGAGVTVAVVDTGIDERNPDLAGALVAEHCVVPPDGCPNGTGEQDGPGSARDDEGHGTEIAGLIAGNGTTAPVGVAPGAWLVAVKVTDRNGRTSTGQIVAGLQWVLDRRPDVRVVNVSLAGDILLSGSCDSLTPALAQYSSVIRTLLARGVLVFAPSGNAGSRFSMGAPACFHSTVSVGAVYSQAFGPYTAPFVCRDATTARTRSPASRTRVPSSTCSLPGRRSSRRRSAAGARRSPGRRPPPPRPPAARRC
jgi:subtilisin family serine protease